MKVKKSLGGGLMSKKRHRKRQEVSNTNNSNNNNNRQQQMNYNNHFGINPNQLLSMFGELDGKHDDLLRMSKPVTGSYYFAPSYEVLKAL